MNMSQPRDSMIECGSIWGQAVYSLGMYYIPAHWQMERDLLHSDPIFLEVDCRNTLAQPFLPMFHHNCLAKVSLV